MKKYVCDLCKRYYDEKSTISFDFPLSIYEKKRYDLCHDCLWEIKNALDHKTPHDGFFDRLKARWRHE